RARARPARPPRPRCRTALPAACATPARRARPTGRSATTPRPPPSRHLAVAGRELAVLLLKAADQPFDAAGRGLLRELRSIGLDEPDPEHVDVVDLPVVARLAHPVVELRGLAAGLQDLRAHDDVGVAGGGTERLHPDL